MSPVPSHFGTTWPFAVPWQIAFADEAKRKKHNLIN